MTIDIVVIVIYAIAMLALGWVGMRRAKSSEDYLVAGRSLGPWMYMGTMAATVLGGASTIGTVRLGYVYGISGVWLCVALGCGIIVLNLFLAKHLLKLKILTVSQLFERRYNPAAKKISSVIMFCYAVMICVVSFIAIGSIAQVFLGLAPWAAVVLGGGIVVIYSTIGGMWSLTLTDMVQFLIKTAGMMLVLLPICYYQVGGWEAVHTQLPASAFDITALGWDKVVTFFLIYFCGIIMGQDIWQRVFTAKSDRVAKLAGTAAGIYCLVYGAVGAFIGMCAHVLMPNIADVNNTFAVVVQELLPPGIRGLVIAAALSAMMSTASAGLLAGSTTLSEDLLSHERYKGLGWTRMLTLLVGLCAGAIALLVSDILVALTIAFNLLVGGLFVCLFGTIYWRRATTSGAIASMLSGFIACAVMMAIDGLDANRPIYVSVCISLVSFVAVSCFTRGAAYEDVGLDAQDPVAPKI